MNHKIKLLLKNSPKIAKNQLKRKKKTFKRSFSARDFFCLFISRNYCSYLKCVETGGIEFHDNVAARQCKQWDLRTVQILKVFKTLQRSNLHFAWTTSKGFSFHHFLFKSYNPLGNCKANLTVTFAPFSSLRSVYIEVWDFSFHP